MNVSACSICMGKVATNLQQNDHFCQRCEPFAQDYLTERAKMLEQGMRRLDRELGGFRERYLRERILGKLKAVPSAG